MRRKRGKSKLGLAEDAYAVRYRVPRRTIHTIGLESLDAMTELGRELLFLVKRYDAAHPKRVGSMKKQRDKRKPVQRADVGAMMELSRKVYASDPGNQLLLEQRKAESA